MERTINIDGRDVKLKTNGGILRRYRAWTGHDIVADMGKIISIVSELKDDDDLPIEALERFENVAYAMNRYADPDNVPDNIDDWLESFDTFDIYQVFPVIIEMWNGDNEVMSTEKKSNVKQ